MQRKNKMKTKDIIKKVIGSHPDNLKDYEKIVFAMCYKAGISYISKREIYHDIHRFNNYLEYNIITPLTMTRIKAGVAFISKDIDTNNKILKNSERKKDYEKTYDKYKNLLDEKYNEFRKEMEIRMEEWKNGEFKKWKAVINKEKKVS